MSAEIESPLGERRPTLRDVAAHARVSPMSVSRALRGAPGLSEATRLRVLESADALGYRPNEYARSLRLGGESGLIGLVVPDLANPFYSGFAKGVEEHVEANGYSILVANSREDSEREHRLVETLVDKRAAGLIVMPSGSSTAAETAAGQTRIAQVFAGRPPEPGVQADCVLVDDFGGARAATQALIGHGHRRIGFIGDPPAVYTGGERFRGYAAALDQAGVGIDDEVVVRNATTADDAATALAALVATRTPPTAVFCTNNRLVLGALLKSKELGVELDMACFDDIEYADLLDRRMVVARCDSHELGSTAAKMLLGRLSSPESEALPARLVLPVDVSVHGGR